MSQPPQPPPPPSPPPTGGPVGQPYSPQGGTNGLATAALICGIVGFFCLIPAILALVFGYRARSQIDASGGERGGRGTATAGIVLGWIWIALTVLWVVVAAVAAGSDS
ncbi:MAG: DUF4190 domain-containing protein [Acidimicrobiia bacterium]